MCHLEVVADLGVLVSLLRVAEDLVELGHGVRVPAKVRVQLHLLDSIELFNSRKKSKRLRHHG